MSPTIRKDPRGITTPTEVTEERLLGHNRRCHMDPGARPVPRNNPGKSSTSATSHDRAAATIQHLKSRANGDSANPRVCEPVSQVYERPPPRRTTQTTKKNPVESKMAPQQRKTVVQSTTHRVAFVNKPWVVRVKSEPPKPESTVEQFMRPSTSQTNSSSTS